ncbi:MAG TPA: hypothetical protein GX002_02715 [Clostridiales bacterium]|jgi:hypothetical protein|nr:hypothetical protein [Clostridiales bacterium]
MAGKNKCKFAILIFCILIIFSVLQNKDTVYAADNYKLITSNNRYNLYFDEETANVKFEDRITNTTWTTFPEDWEEDTMSKGAVRENIAAHILLDVYGKSDNMAVVNSYTQGVKKKQFSYEALEQGLAITYNLKNIGVNITIEFHLTDTGFKVIIPSSEIEENKDSIISNISILPFFFTGKKGEDGYLFVPDGCGMLVRFTDNFSLYRNVTKPVYGRDYATNIPSSQLIEENYLLPVYGVKNEDKGAFAIIEKPDARASITTGVAGFMYNRFRNYCTISYRERNEIAIKNNVGLETTYPRWSEAVSGNIEVSYYLLTKDMSDYSDMARIYQDYLVENMGLKKNVSDKGALDLTLIGSVKMRKSFLGIPITMNVPLTTFKQAKTIITSLQNRGVDNINIRYLGYNKNGYLDQWTGKVRPAGKLGGTKNLKNLIAFSMKNNVNLFLSGELIQVYKSGNGFSISKHAVRTISNAVLQVFNYSNITGNLLRGNGTRYLTSPKFYVDAFKGFLKGLVKLSANSVAFEDVGTTIYSDYNKNYNITRDESKDYILEALDIPESIRNVMYTGGNAYVLGTATHLADVPLYGSNSQITAEYVPFYQMVIHGYINYSGKAFNYSSNHKKDLLKTIEYGANIHFIGIYEESSKLKNSKINYILSACYKDWIDEASEMYRKISIAYDGIYNKRMIDHYKLDHNVYVTKYEGGISTIVNYNDYNYVVDDKITVNAMDFMIVEGGSKF